MRDGVIVLLLVPTLAAGCGRALPASPAPPALAAAATAPSAAATPSDIPTVAATPEPTPQGTAQPAAPPPTPVQPRPAPPPPTPTPPMCLTGQPWSMGFGARPPGAILVVWSTPARCPLIGTLTSTGGLLVPVSGNGGQYLDHPPPAYCKVGVSYSLTLHFQGSFNYPPMTDNSGPYC